MGRVAKSERTKAQLRAERRGLKRAKRVMSRPAPSGLSAPMPSRKRPALFNPKIRRRVVNKAKREENADARRELRYDRQVREGKRKGFVLRRDPAKAQAFVLTTNARGQRQPVPMPKSSTLPRTVDPITPKASKAFKRAESPTIKRQARAIARDIGTVSSRKGSVNRQNEAVQRLRDFGVVSGKSRSKAVRARKRNLERQANARRASKRRQIERQGGYKTGDPLKLSGLSTVIGAGKEAGQNLAFLVSRQPREFAAGGPLMAGAALAGKSIGTKAGKKVAKGRKPSPTEARLVQAAGLTAPTSVSKRLKAKRPENILRILEQTQRPVYGVAGAANEGVKQVKKGKFTPTKIGKEFGRGITLKDREYFSDVLKTAGVRNAAVAAGVGLVLDIALDPTTYVTLGAGAAAGAGAKATARAAAGKVGRKVYKAELKKGAPKAAAKATARRRAQAEFDRVLKYESVERDKSGKVKVDEQGKPIRRKGSQVSIGTKKRNVRVNLPSVSEKLKLKRGFQRKRKANGEPPMTAREAGSKVFSPRIEPADLSAGVYEAANDIGRGVRAIRNTGLAESQLWTQHLSGAIPKKFRQTVFDAGELEGKARQELLDTLPSKVQNATVEVPVYSRAPRKVRGSKEATPEREIVGSRKIRVIDAIDAFYKREDRIRRRLGQGQGKIENYRPHMLKESVEPGRTLFGRKRKAAASEDIVAEGKVISSTLSSNPQRVAGSTRRRNLRMTRQEAADDFNVQFSGDDPLVAGNYRADRIVQEQRNLVRNRIDDIGENVPIRTEFDEPVKRLSKEKVQQGARIYNSLRAKGYSKKVAKRRAREIVSSGDARRTVALGRMDPEGYEKVYVHTNRSPDGAGSYAEVREATAGELAQLQDGIVPSHITRVTKVDSRAMDRVVDSFSQYTDLNKIVADLRSQNKRVYAWATENLIGKVYDPLMRGWKGVATRTPTFHIRNMIGDFSMAYNVVPGTEIWSRTKDALKITWYLRGMRGNPYGFTKRNAFVKINGEKVPVSRIAQEMADEGVIIGGVLGSDLETLARHGVNGISRVNSKVRVAARGVDNTLQDRENLMRMVVYMHFRDAGYSRVKAARETANAMIDYGELSKGERELWKRVAPFYVFAARSIPIYAITLVRRPGKIGNIEKIRQEAGNAQGLEADMIRNDAGYRQRAYGFPLRLEEDFGIGPLKLPKGTYLVSNGLPLMALGQLPTFFSKDPAALQADLAAFYETNLRYWGASLSPIIGAGVETALNRSFFYGRTLQTDYRPLTPAPVGNFLKLAAAFGKTTEPISGTKNNARTIAGIGTMTSRRTGKQVTGWSPQFENAILKFTAGAPGFALNLSRDENRRGQNDWQAVISFLSGQKFDPYEKNGRKLENAFEVWTQLNDQYNKLSPLADSDAKVKQQRLYVGRMQREVAKYINSIGRQPGDKYPIFSIPGGKSKDSGSSRKQDFNLGGGSSGFKLGGGSSGFKLGGD